MKKKLAFLLLPLLASTLFGCKNNQNVTINPEVNFVNEYYEVEVGSRITTKANVSPDSTKKVVYELKNVSPSGCASIEGSVVTGNYEGTATIVATLDDNKTITDSAYITVVKANKHTEYAVVLREYTIKGFDDTCTLFSPSGIKIETDGMFLPTELGVYKVYKNYRLYMEITVLYEALPVDIELSEEIVPEVHTNLPVVVPKAHLFSNIEEFDIYDVYIEKNNEIVDYFQNITDSFEYTFMESGKYNICYLITDAFGFDVKKSFEINILPYKEIVNIDFQKNWSVLSTIDFSNVYGLFEGVRYPVDISLTNSSGTEVEIENNKYTFNKEGAYKLVILCNFNDEVIRKEIDLNVELSKASYFSNGNNIVSVEKSENTSANNGVEIKANGSGSYIYYSNVINLDKYTKNDKLTDFYVVCDKESEMEDIRVTLIDANNEDNYFSIYWKRSKSVGWEHLTYCLIEFNGYSCAICNEAGKADYGKLREIYGAILTCSLKNNNAYSFNFTYDKDENAVYTYRTDSSGTKLIPLIDFDDKELLGNYSPWNGFSSSNVYMKIDFINNIKSKIRVSNIDGKDLKDSTGEIKDDEFLTFNYLGDKYLRKESININSYVNYATKLPEPNTNSILKGEVGVKLDLYYKNIEYERIDTKIDDYKFTPTQSGEYKAVYSYFDVYGKTQNVEIPFTCKNEEPDDIEIYLDGYGPSTTSISADYLTTFTIPNIVVNGGVGTISKNITCKLLGKEEITPNEYNEIYLNRKGYINICVSVIDDICREVTKIFRLNINSRIQRINLVEEPKTFMAGRQIYLLDFKAIDYSFDEGEPGYEMEKSVFIDGEPINNLTFVCPSDKDFVTISYFGGKGTAKEVRKDVVVKVVPANNDNVTLLDELFDGVKNASNAELFDEGYAISMNSDLNIDFVNPLVSRSCNFTFTLIEGKINFDSLNFKLTDYQNSNEVLKVEFKNLSLDSIDMFLNNERVATIKGSKGKYDNGPFNGASYSMYSFNLLDYIKAFTLDSNAVLTYISSTLNGRKYNGFESGLFNLEISTSNTDTNSAVVIRSLSNQIFTTYSLIDGCDRKSPVIGTLTEFNKNYSFLEEIVIPKSVGSDVLQGRVDYVDLTVIAPSGATKKFDGTQNNTYRFEEYGLFTFQYKTSDYYGNNAEYLVYVNVYDEEKPVITVNFEMPTTLNIGDTLDLSNVKATDNIGVVTLKTYVYTPESKLIEVNGKYTFNTRGQYKVIYYAADQRGNYAKVIFDILVK